MLACVASATAAADTSTIPGFADPFANIKAPVEYVRAHLAIAAKPTVDVVREWLARPSQGPDDKRYVPLATLGLLLGVPVKWDAEHSTADVACGESRLAFVVGGQAGQAKGCFPAEWVDGALCASLSTLSQPGLDALLDGAFAKLSALDTLFPGLGFVGMPTGGAISVGLKENKQAELGVFDLSASASSPVPTREFACVKREGEYWVHTRVLDKALDVWSSWNRPKTILGLTLAGDAYAATPPKFLKILYSVEQVDGHMLIPESVFGHAVGPAGMRILDALKGPSLEVGGRDVLDARAAAEALGLPWTSCDLGPGVDWCRMLKGGQAPLLLMSVKGHSQVLGCSDGTSALCSPKAPQQAPVAAY